MSGAAEKVPGWVEGLLIPNLEKVRAVVKEEIQNLEKVMDARFEAVNSKMEARFEAVNAKVDSLEKRFPSVQELAEIKARLRATERERQ